MPCCHFLLLACFVSLTSVTEMKETAGMPAVILTCVSSLPLNWIKSDQSAVFEGEKNQVLFVCWIFLGFQEYYWKGCRCIQNFDILSSDDAGRSRAHDRNHQRLLQDSDFASTMTNSTATAWLRLANYFFWKIQARLQASGMGLFYIRVNVKALGSLAPDPGWAYFA